jgi:hypothetical protein
MRPHILLPNDPPPPADDFDFEPDEIDDDSPLEFDDEYWEALTPDHDYEPLPEHGDFWTDDI